LRSKDLAGLISSADDHYSPLLCRSPASGLASRAFAPLWQWNQSDDAPFFLQRTCQNHEEQTMSPRTQSSRHNGGSHGSGYHILDDVLAMAGSLAKSRKDYAADKLESLAESVRDFAGAVPDMPNFRAYVNEAAASLEGLADYVTRSDLETMAVDVREFARAHPIATLAGSIAAGIIVIQMMQARAIPFSHATRRGSAARRTGGGKRLRGERRRSGSQRHRANA
jgi:hypothetical protein